MSDYIEGKRPIIEALRIGVPLRRIFLADNAKRDPLVEDIMRKARRCDVDVKLVARAKLDELSAHGSHQGVIAESKRFGYVGVGDLIDAAQTYAEANDGRALIVLLDHITDAGNLGAIIRSAESAGAVGVVIPNKRSAHVNATTYKTSAGAVAHLAVAQTSNMVQAIKRLQEAGFWIAAASEHASDYLWDVNLKGKIGLVMGNEHDGVSRLVLERCDLAGKLPMMGEVSSLNVAQASTALMYEWLRQNRPASTLRGAEQAGAAKGC
ncbi:23S rRNA (guanosine(2251)-2'-O)-methyltransferase RlmB [Eggerthellaceae bacterium zg-1084]|uniref:23S rRNA (guanosine(2251)-2'-O)-methyltransferase RlmB n=1 Tax=Berryella wangjianweii TaxID=2734634 RepID=UPI001551D2B4|nr:23S rRNA (guanosine(2251)-2'-O)-methyltransferase RlmB [Berryella wangjianweii]NPD30495.1 23S rRNA (guanosine(2251)-2'-O)-methyltransferase RlmB [Berryella wangjianweii]